MCWRVGSDHPPHPWIIRLVTGALVDRQASKPALSYTMTVRVRIATSTRSAERCVRARNEYADEKASDTAMHEVPAVPKECCLSRCVRSTFYFVNLTTFTFPTFLSPVTRDRNTRAPERA